MSYLKASRNYQSFFEKLSVRSLSYQLSVKSALTNFDKFFKEKFDRDLEHVIRELISIKDKEAFEETLQTWINWNEKRHMSLSAIKIYYGYFNNFREANLENANFKNAGLNHANFLNANLTNADLSGADLRKSLLEGANLEGATLDNAILSNANLRCVNHPICVSG